WDQSHRDQGHRDPGTREFGPREPWTDGPDRERDGWTGPPPPRAARGAASVPQQWSVPPLPEPDIAPPDRRPRPSGRASVAPPPAGYDRPAGAAPVPGYERPGRDRPTDPGPGPDRSGRAAERPGRRPIPVWMTALGISAVVIVVVVLVLGGYVMFTGRDSSSPPADTGPTQRDISTRQADP